MAISRRNILLAAGAAVVGVMTYTGITAKPEAIVVSILQRRLGYLKVADGTFQKFAVEYIHYKEKEAKRLQMLALFAWPLRVVTPYSLLPQGHALRRLENDVVGRFLLATDFFQNGADEQRGLQYIGFFDPLERPCSNPVMRFANMESAS